MYCKNCGAEITENQENCPVCNTKVGFGKGFCSGCGKAVAPEAAVCISCGRLVEAPKPQSVQMPQSIQKPVKEKKTKNPLPLILGCCAIFALFFPGIIAALPLSIIALVISVKELKKKNIVKAFAIAGLACSIYALVTSIIAAIILLLCLLVYVVIIIFYIIVVIFYIVYIALLASLMF